MLDLACVNSSHIITTEAHRTINTDLFALGRAIPLKSCVDVLFLSLLTALKQGGAGTLGSRVDRKARQDTKDHMLQDASPG